MIRFPNITGLNNNAHVRGNLCELDDDALQPLPTMMEWAHAQNQLNGRLIPLLQIRLLLHQLHNGITCPILFFLMNQVSRRPWK